MASIWLCDFRVGRRAVAGGKFQALIFRGIMAGGHVDAAERFAARIVCAITGVGVSRLQSRGVRPLRGQHFSGGQGKFAPEEARVMADDDTGWQGKGGARRSN